MRKIKPVLLFCFMIFILVSCSSQTPITAASFMDGLVTGLDENDLPYDYSMPESEPDTTKAYGDCMVTQYEPALGIIVKAIENKDQTALHEILIYANPSVATREKLSSAAFCMGYLINTFEPKDGDRISENLGMSDISTPGFCEADGTAGHYEFVVTKDGLLYLTYTNHNDE